MKNPKPLLLLLVLISMAACKKNTLPIKEHIQLKAIQNDIELSDAIGDFVNGYDISFSLYSKFEENPYFPIEYYRCIWNQPIQGNEYMLYQIQVNTVISPNPLSSSDDHAILIDDPRLGKPPYSKISVVKLDFNDDSRWHYIMRIDSYEERKFVQRIFLSGGLTSNSDYWDPSVQVQPAPSDEATVTALLRLIEPMAIDSYP